MHLQTVVVFRVSFSIVAREKIATNKLNYKGRQVFLRHAQYFFDLVEKFSFRAQLSLRVMKV